MLFLHNKFLRLGVQPNKLQLIKFLVCLSCAFNFFLFLGSSAEVFKIPETMK